MQSLRRLGNRSRVMHMRMTKLPITLFEVLEYSYRFTTILRLNSGLKTVFHFRYPTMQSIDPK